MDVSASKLTSDELCSQDWWLTPELYLRRPPASNEQWRLDRLLKRKAEEGVKIYVIVYKEVTQTMSLSSHHTKVEILHLRLFNSALSNWFLKETLEALHPNIACMRHPDHIGSKGQSGTQYIRICYSHSRQTT